MEEVHIRGFVYPQDYHSARNLWENSGSGIQLRRSDEPDEIDKKWRHDPDLFLVAEAQGRLVGTVIGGFDGRRGMVYHLAVSSDFQKQGIADALMVELEKRLVRKGCLRCYLLVTNENEPAIRFYEHRGWEHMQHVRIYGKDLK